MQVWPDTMVWWTDKTAFICPWWLKILGSPACLCDFHGRGWNAKHWQTKESFDPLHIRQMCTCPSTYLNYLHNTDYEFESKERKASSFNFQGIKASSLKQPCINRPLEINYLMPSKDSETTNSELKIQGSRLNFETQKNITLNALRFRHFRILSPPNEKQSQIWNTELGRLKKLKPIKIPAFKNSFTVSTSEK